SPEYEPEQNLLAWKTAIRPEGELAEAQELVTEYMQRDLSNTNPKIKPTGIHQLIINNAYHFYMPRKIKGIPLTGYYVDGNTGEVEFRNVEGSVRYPQKSSKSAR